MLGLRQTFLVICLHQLTELVDKAVRQSALVIELTLKILMTDKRLVTVRYHCRSLLVHLPTRKFLIALVELSKQALFPLAENEIVLSLLVCIVQITVERRKCNLRNISLTKHLDKTVA